MPEADIRIGDDWHTEEISEDCTLVLDEGNTMRDSGILSFWDFPGVPCEDRSQNSTLGSWEDQLGVNTLIWGPNVSVDDDEIVIEGTAPPDDIDAEVRVPVEHVTSVKWGNSENPRPASIDEIRQFHS
jgi:hypothetical protein